MFHKLRPQVATGSWKDIWDRRVPKSLLSDIKNIVRQLQEGERKSPWSEWEIKHLLHGEVWPGISFLDPSNINPIRVQQRQTLTESDSDAPLVGRRPIVLPSNSNFVRVAGLTNEASMERSQQQFEDFVVQEFEEPQPEHQPNKRPRRDPQRGEDDPELPAVDGEASEVLAAEPSKAPPPWHGRVIGFGKSKKGALATHAFVWFFNNRGFPSTENYLVPIATLASKLDPSCIPACMAEPSDWEGNRKQTEIAARKWLLDGLGFKPGKRVAVNFGTMDNATISKVTKQAVEVEYDDATTYYNSWDPLSPKRDWRCIEEGLDEAIDLIKPQGDASSNSSDSDS